MRWVRYVGLVALAAAGCGPSAPELHPVTGRVVFKDGRVIEGAMVEFVSENGFGARAKTGPDGRFELATDGRKGAVKGTHRVAVVQMLVVDGAGPHLTKDHARHVIHSKYASLNTSGLTREVKVGPNDFLLELDPADDKRGGWAVDRKGS
jgi:hypothetical protein